VCPVTGIIIIVIVGGPPHGDAKRIVCWVSHFVPERVVWIENSNRQAAEQVLKLTNAHRILEPMIRQLQQRQLKQLEEMNLPNEAHVITGEYILRMNELLKAELAWDKMKDEYINLLVRRW